MHKNQTIGHVKTGLPAGKMLCLTSITLGDLAGFLLINLLFFQVALQPIISFAGYLDELACLLLCACSLLVKQRPLSRELRIGMGIYLLFILFEILGTMSTDLPIAKEAILIDAFTCVKFPLALLAAYRCFALSKRLLYLLQAEAKLLLLVLAMLAF